MAFNFMPLLSPTNQMNYNTVQFYNAALAIVAGCSVAPLAFRLLPLPSPEVRARRFLALTLRDMRRLAVGLGATEAAGLGGLGLRPPRCIA